MTNLRKHFTAAATTGIQLDRKAGRADITLDVTGDVLHTGLHFGDHDFVPESGRMKSRLDWFNPGAQIDITVVFLTPKDEEDTHIWISSITEQPSGYPWFPLEDDLRDFITRILRDIL
jgi:hypothetical protein